jgi:LmbE family N-acetylglucosaminyl deacetylase
MIRLSTRLLVISPHLDDAVLSCAGALMHSTDAVAATLLAGTPADSLPLTDWDQRCGYTSASQAMQARRREDQAALSRLGAGSRHLDFLDAQYAPTHDVEDLATAIQMLVKETLPATILVPLGLFHSDHLLVHDAAMRVCSRGRGARHWLCYEDSPYARKPGLLQERLAHLHARGRRLTPVSLCTSCPDDEARKLHALEHYRSQLHHMGLAGAGAKPLPTERYWQIEDAAQ